MICVFVCGVVFRNFTCYSTHRTYQNQRNSIAIQTQMSEREKKTNRERKREEKLWSLVNLIRAHVNFDETICCARSFGIHFKGKNPPDQSTCIERWATIVAVSRSPRASTKPIAFPQFSSLIVPVFPLLPFSLQTMNGVTILFTVFNLNEFFNFPIKMFNRHRQRTALSLFTGWFCTFGPLCV